VDFQKQRSNKEEEEPESELIVKITGCLNLIEGLRMTETGVMLSADSDCNEQRATANGQRIVSLLVVLL